MERVCCGRSACAWISLIFLSMIVILPSGSAQLKWMGTAGGWELILSGNPSLPSWAAWSFDKVERTALVLMCQPTGVATDNPLQWNFYAWDPDTDSGLINEQALVRRGFRDIRFFSGGDVPRSRSPYGFLQVFQDGSHPVLPIRNGDPIETQVGTLRFEPEAQGFNNSVFVVGYMNVGGDEREHFSMEQSWDKALAWVLRHCRKYMRQYEPLSK